MKAGDDGFGFGSKFWSCAATASAKAEDVYGLGRMQDDIERRDEQTMFDSWALL